MTEEKKLQAYLQAGERVLWEGSPSRFPLLEGPFKKRILTQWIASIAVCGGFLAWYLSNDVPKEPGMILLLGVILATLLFSPVWEHFCLQKQRYWMTDRRCILMCWDKSFYTLPLEDVDAYRVIRNQSAAPCVVLGSSRFEDIDKQLRWRACHPHTDLQKNSRGDCMDGMVIYSVENLDEMVKLMKSRSMGKTA